MVVGGSSCNSFHRSPSEGVTCSRHLVATTPQERKAFHSHITSKAAESRGQTRPTLLFPFGSRPTFNILFFPSLFSQLSLTQPCRIWQIAQTVVSLLWASDLPSAPTHWQGPRTVPRLTVVWLRMQCWGCSGLSQPPWHAHCATYTGCASVSPKYTGMCGGSAQGLFWEQYCSITGSHRETKNRERK